MPIFCEMFSNRLKKTWFNSSNFMAVHRRNVDQIDMPVLVCIAIGLKAVFFLFFLKKKTILKMAADPNFFLRKF